MNYIKQQLKENGWAIIQDILSDEEIELAKNKFLEWQKTIPDHNAFHNNCNPHGIYKYHQAGHQWHSWFIRTRPSVQRVFRSLWNTDELIVSFDGCGYIPKDCKKRDTIWTHTDQAPAKDSLECYQGLVSLTNNKERTFVVYNKSHLLHKSYFESKNIHSTQDWNKIDPAYLKTIADSKRVLNIPAGSLVLWDSRTFHQNQYGLPECGEDRLVQYVCYLPKSHPKNTKAMQNKRRKYFEEKRTTSHWPAPIHVNSLQPRNKEFKIDYLILKDPHLTDFKDDIELLL